MIETARILRFACRRIAEEAWTGPFRPSKRRVDKDRITTMDGGLVRVLGQLIDACADFDWTDHVVYLSKLR